MGGWISSLYWLKYRTNHCEWARCQPLLVIVYQTDLDSIPKTGSRKKLEKNIEKSEGRGLQFLSACPLGLILGYAKFASYHVMENAWNIPDSVESSCTVEKDMNIFFSLPGVITQDKNPDVFLVASPFLSFLYCVWELNPPFIGDFPWLFYDPRIMDRWWSTKKQET